MSPRVQVVLGLVVYAAIAAALWPVFTGGVEPALKWAFLALAVLGGFAVVTAWRSRRRWARYALIGMLPGFLIGGIGLAWLVWLGSALSPTGWEDLAIIAAGIFGAFSGAVAGAVLGAIVGLFRDAMTDRRAG